MDREEFETALDAAIADGTMGEGAEILREQYIVYAANQGFEYFDDMADLVGQFEDAYMGEWDSFREYSDDYVESTDGADRRRDSAPASPLCEGSGSLAPGRRTGPRRQRSR